jgi:glycosyltransferase involved in cell wall biosynthesis
MGAGFPRASCILDSLLALGHRIYVYPTTPNTPSENKEVIVCPEINSVSGKMDVVIIARPHNIHYTLPVVKQSFRKAKVIYDTEALWFRRFELQQQITGRVPYWWAFPYDEIGLARHVDLVWAVNDEEKKMLEDGGAKKVMKLGHALSPNYNGKTFKDRSKILMVGGLMDEDSSNEDAVWWFLHNCYHYLDSLEYGVGDFINVVGSAKTLRLQDYSVFLGWIKDLQPLYESYRVFVAPTRFATGIPWKVHEAMANGIPCVISHLLAKQLCVTDGKEALVATEPEEFALKVKYLYNDEFLWERIRANAYEFVDKDCNPDEFQKTISESLEYILSV